jgi:hypothetical protein
LFPGKDVNMAGIELHALTLLPGQGHQFFINVAV